MKKLFKTCWLVAGGLVLAGLTASCSSGNDKKGGDSSDWHDSATVKTMDSSQVADSLQDIAEVADAEANIDKEEIKKRIKHIWFELPPGLVAYDLYAEDPRFEKRVRKVMTKSMGDKFSAGLKAYRQADDEGELLDIAESLFCLWGAQDPDPNGKLTFKNISVVSPDRIEAKVSYMNYTSPEEHKLILKKENGEWLLDDIDNTKSITF